MAKVPEYRAAVQQPRARSQVLNGQIVGQAWEEWRWIFGRRNSQIIKLRVENAAVVAVDPRIQIGLVGSLEGAVVIPHEFLLELHRHIGGNEPLDIAQRSRPLGFITGDGIGNCPAVAEPKQLKPAETLAGGAANRTGQRKGNLRVVGIPFNTPTLHELEVLLLGRDQATIDPVGVRAAEIPALTTFGTSSIGT